MTEPKTTPTTPTTRAKPTATVPDAARVEAIREVCDIAISGCFADVETRELLALVDAQAKSLARANELLAGARSQCVARMQDLAAAEVHIRHLQREAVVGHFVLGLERQILRMRRLDADRAGVVPRGTSPANLLAVLRDEIAEVEKELAGSPAAQRESTDVLAAAMHLLIANGGVLLVELEAIVARLDQRLSAVELGATWEQAKDSVAEGLPS